MRLNELMHVKLTEQSETQPPLPEFCCCSFLGGLVCLVFSLYTLHFLSRFPKYRGKYTSCYLSPSPQHGAQQNLATSRAVVEAVESFTFLWHFDTVQNYWSWFLGTIWLHSGYFQTKFCFLLERWRVTASQPWHRRTFSWESGSPNSLPISATYHLSYSFLFIYFWLFNCVIIYIYIYIYFKLFILYWSIAD